jgi:hypothetical protein
VEAAMHGNTLLVAVLSGLMAAAQPPNVSRTEHTVTARVERIETGRVVTLRTDDNAFQTVYVDPGVKALDGLRVGDRVTVRYIESVIVKVRPNAAPSAARDTSAAAREGGTPHVVDQQTAVVTIESVDPQRLFVTYRRADGAKIARAVQDPQLLEGLRPGDRVEVTFTRERAISVER